MQINANKDKQHSISGKHTAAIIGALLALLAIWAAFHALCGFPFGRWL